MNPPETGSDEDEEQLAEETAPQVVTQATRSTNASSTKATPSTDSLAATPLIASDSKMGSTKIRPFKGLRNGREDPSEYIEDLEWLHEQHYKANGPEPDKTLRLLFRQNLEDAAYDWYIDLEKETKNNWTELRKAFLKAFEVTEKDAQAKKFELRMKIAQLRQEDKENIADYLKRAAELARKMVHDDIDVGMATLRGMRDQFKREQINFECNKSSDYDYLTVERLIKAAYSEVGKPNPFDPDYKDARGLVLPGNGSLTNDELLRQVLINTNQAFPTLLQSFRSLNLAANNGITIRQPTASQPTGEPSRTKKDLSEIKCYRCGEFGHYASTHDPPANTDRPRQQTIVASSALPAAQATQDAERYYPTTAACLLPISGNAGAPVMIAQRPSTQPSKQQRVTLQPAGVQKNTKPKSTQKSSKVGLEHLAEEGDQENAGTVEEMDTNSENEEVEETVESPSTFPVAQPSRSRQQPPPTRVTKTGKVQELVQPKAPKLPDPIRAMTNRPRFDVDTIFSLPVEIPLGELLDRSDVTVKEMAYAMQRATPRYRVKRATKTKAVEENPSAASLVLAASVQKHPPEVTAHAQEDDGQSQPVMITSWIGAVKLTNTLLDGGSVVELVNRRKLQTMKPPPSIHSDGHLRVCLATDVISTLTNYAYLPVNVEGVQALVKAWVVDNQVYDLLLGLSWMRRVAFCPDFGTGKVVIKGNDGIVRRVPAELCPMEVHLPTVELEVDEDDGDTADAACQYLLDQQEKV